MTFLTILFIVIAGFWLLKRLLPYLLLRLLARAARRGSGAFYTNVPPTGGGGFGGRAATGASSKPEGEVTIEVPAPPSGEAHKGVSKTIGEYVEYQEEDANIS